MIRRAFWGLVGIGLGAVVGGQTVRWASKTSQRLAPPNLARAAAGSLGVVVARARDAVSAGMEEMIVREAELRHELNLPNL